MSKVENVFSVPCFDFVMSNFFEATMYNLNEVHGLTMNSGGFPYFLVSKMRFFACIRPTEVVSSVHKNQGQWFV